MFTHGVIVLQWLAVTHWWLWSGFFPLSKYLSVELLHLLNTCTLTWDLLLSLTSRCLEAKSGDSHKDNQGLESQPFIQVC